MFDMGFTEVMLISIVALVVIGPERLPGVARTAGKYFSRLRNFMTNVRADVESELKADELREMLKKQQEELSSLKDVVSDVGKDLNLSEDIGVADIKKSIEEAMPDLDTSVDPEPIAETRPAPKASVKASSKKKSAAKKKASPKAKLTPKAKATPKKTKASPKVSAKAKASPKAKAASKKVKAVPKTKTATKTRAKPKTVAKSKSKTGSSWASSIVPPNSSTDTNQS
ncbi:MAG: twin-arginine translocase subunit TatB [Gammaproteobacteria bacterium]|nr:MAG: twin-arginine translocase subunit TatB [Gammaproteobacteria bacterium]